MGIVGLFWGIGGIAFILSFASYRMFNLFLDALSSPLLWYHWCFLLVVTGILMYGKVYKGFHSKLSPFIAKRAQMLYERPTFLRVFLAPFFCFGYIGGERKNILRRYGFTIAMVILLSLIKFVPNPWRGLVDFGVSVGLVCGLFSIVYFTRQMIQPATSTA